MGVVLCRHIRLRLFVVMGVGHGDGLALQPLLELRITLGDGDMADGIPQGTLLTDDNADFLGTGHGGVDKVALEHDVVGEVDGDDDDGIFAALTLVDGRGIGETKFVKFRGLVFHCLTVEADGQCAVLHIDSGNESDVAVKHFLGVVVLELQHTVAFAEYESGTGESVAGGVDTLLDGHVQTVTNPARVSPLPVGLTRCWMDMFRLLAPMALRCMGVSTCMLLRGML